MQAYAAAKFADACLRGLHGDAGIVECSFVASQVLIKLFSSPDPTFLILQGVYNSLVSTTGD